MSTRGADGTVGAPTALSEAADALAWFRARVPVTRAEWDALEAAARQRAFTVSGVATLDVLAQVWDALDKALAVGTAFDEFRRDVGAAIAAAWGKSDSPRVETIFRNGVQSAYAAGRYQQMTSPAVLQARPFWEFQALLDARTTPICQPLDGLVRAAGDPFWQDHYPPLHHRCRSGVVTLTAAQAEASGGLAQTDHDAAPPPAGWGSTAGLGAYAPDPARYPAPLWAAYQRWQAAREDRPDA